MRTPEQGLSGAREIPGQSLRLTNGDTRAREGTVIAAVVLIVTQCMKTFVYLKKLLFYLLQKLSMLIAGKLENTGSPPYLWVPHPWIQPTEDGK